MMLIISAAGQVKSGKTFFIEELARGLKLRDYKIRMLKHKSIAFNLGKPGEDSYRLMGSGGINKLLPGF